ncbi:FecR family protein [Chitinophaga sp. Cy-1792]|uniref:FecR family protein n=1 Tax=Chitinophaga sp. Cy-1792 TaxID=2608339 RepID=UPI0014215D68
MNTDQIKILLEKYNQGNCSPEEAHIIEQWFENINRHQSVVKNDDVLQLDLDEVKSLINEQIAPQREVTPPAPAENIRSLRPWYFAAAAAAVFAAIIVTFTFTRNKTDISQPMAADFKTSTRALVNGFIEITTPSGIAETVTLEDGSTITMNGSSKLRYPQHFDKKARNIWLEEGEALFDAARDPARSFTVYSGSIATSALGTSFNVRSYAHEDDITVSLISGKVKVERKGNEDVPTILLPSEKISFNRISLNMIRSSFSNPDYITGWKKGTLNFKDANFDEIARTLKGRFGVTLINQSSKKEWSYKGTFREEGIKELMDDITLARELSYTIQNDTIYLKNKN